MQVLIIAPHADDEVLGAGGVIQWHKGKGDNVHVSVVANRVLGHQIDQNYIAQTRESSSKVKELLGIDEYFFCNLMDEHLDESLIRVIMGIEEVVKLSKPDVAYIPYEDDTNQDHRAVYQACRVACRNTNKILSYEVPSSTIHFKPNFYVEIKQEGILDNKIKAMSYYESETREFPNPRSPEGIKAFAQLRGMECNRKLAEAFILLKEVV